MDTYITAASLVIGLGGGFIAGRLTSGAAGWRNDVDNLQRLYDASVEKIAKLQSINTVLIDFSGALGVKLAAHESAEAKRQAQRVAAAKRAGEVSHANRLAREAEAAALTEQAHSRMAEIIGERAE